LDTYPRKQRVTATTSAGTTSFTTDSPYGDDPGYQDANAGTPYIYCQGTNNSATPVVDSNYVRFIQLLGNVTISADAQISTFPSNDNNNVYINGLQVIPAPEAGVELMLLFGTPLVAWLARRRTLAGLSSRGSHRVWRGGHLGRKLTVRYFSGAAPMLRPSG